MISDFNIITFLKNVRSNNQKWQCYINGKLENKDVAVKDGKISKIGEVSEEAKEVYDAKKPNSLAWMY